MACRVLKSVFTLWCSFGLLGLIVGTAACVDPVPPPGDHPNIVFIFSDQHRMASFPGEPHTDVEAPSLTRLSEEGLLFSNAIGS